MKRKGEYISSESIYCGGGAGCKEIVHDNINLKMRKNIDLNIAERKRGILSG
jgi:hypothetical protein